MGLQVQRSRAVARSQSSKSSSMVSLQGEGRGEGSVVTTGQTMKGLASVCMRCGRGRGVQDNSWPMAWVTKGIGSHQPAWKSRLNGGIRTGGSY